MPLKWQCPACKYTPRLELVFPFHCVCGNRYTAEHAQAIGLVDVPVVEPVPRINAWRWVYEWLTDESEPWDVVTAARKYHSEFVPMIPNFGCSCQADWNELIRAKPIDWTSRESAFASFVEKHNQVSLKIGKKQIPLEQAKALWHGPRVAFVSESYQKIGGTETFHRTLLPELRYHRNITNFVATVHTEGDGSLVQVPYSTGLESAKRAADNCDTLVVWGHSDLAAWLPEKKPKVVSVHHADWSSGWSNDQILKQLDLIDEIVCVNGDVADNLRRATDKPIHFIPNCIDPARIKPSGKQRWLPIYNRIPSDKKILLFGHRLSYEKRPLLAIEIAEKLPDDWVLVIAGDGAQKADCESAMNPNRVRMVGRVESLADWLSISDCFLSLATFEGFGLSIGEAMAMKVPVVSTPTGIAPGLAITLPIDATADQWADAIVKSRNAKLPEDILERFSLSEMVERWAKVLA